MCEHKISSSGRPMNALTVRFDVTVEMIGEHGSPLQTNTKL